jgi:hypothetical protein
MTSVDEPGTGAYTLIEGSQPPPAFSGPGHAMVEYAVLLAQNATDVMSLAGNNLLSWASEFTWARAGIVALALLSIHMGISVFKQR